MRYVGMIYSIHPSVNAKLVDERAYRWSGLGLRKKDDEGL